MEPDVANILKQTNFSTLDWGIVVAYLVVSVVVGLMVKKYVKNMADYVTAGRGVGAALGVATLTGTEMGLVTIMYSAEKGFNSGFAAFHMAAIAGIVTFFVGLTGFFIYRLRQMEVLTIPEYYERRFGRRTRILGGIMLTFGGVLNMGLFLRVGSQFIVGVTGMSAEGWPLPTVMTVLLALVLLYTVLGGMVSVIITDYLQFVVLSFGVLIVTGLCILNLGWDNIFNTIAAEMGEKGFDPLDPAGGFGVEYVLWMLFTAGLVGSALWPTAVARALAADSPQTVKKQFMWCSVSYLIRFMIPYVWGISAFVFIMTKAPDLKEVFFPSAQGAKGMPSLLAMPVVLGRIVPAGLLGVLTAAMIAAFMSTHDSYLLCWSSVITQDIVAPLMGGRLSARARITLTRVLILLIGGYILYWGLIYEGKEDIWDYMAVSGAIYFTGAFALLVCGLYWKRASSTGAVLALLCGLLAILGLGPVRKGLGLDGLLAAAAEGLGLKPTGERITAWIGLGTIILAVAAMIVGSLLFPDKRPAGAAEAEGEG